MATEDGRVAGDVGAIARRDVGEGQTGEQAQFLCGFEEEGEFCPAGGEAVVAGEAHGRRGRIELQGVAAAIVKQAEIS